MSRWCRTKRGGRVYDADRSLAPDVDAEAGTTRLARATSSSPAVAAVTAITAVSGQKAKHFLMTPPRFGLAARFSEPRSAGASFSDASNLELRSEDAEVKIR
jgi:hypothetical protein